MDKEKFIHVYYEKRESIRTIQFIFGVSYDTIVKNMKEWGLERRERSKNMFNN